MQSLIIILFALALLLFILQLSLLRIKRFIFLWPGLVGVFLYLAYPRAIEQSFSIFQENVSNIDLISDLMVIQVIEAVAGILLSIYLLRYYFGEPVKPVFRYFNYIPGIILFPALFYFESYIFLSFPGRDFRQLAIIISISFPAIFVGMRYLLYRLVPEYELRLELKFLLHMAQMMVAISISIMVLQIPARNVSLPVSLFQQLILIFVTALLIIVGSLCYNVKMKKRIKLLKNE